ncbi:hypothetical protein B0H16DRAFT_1484403 [Mycena metata]|uniref:Uncharacterized protein n=1 Tax=Mycena metata TaxID=1033252 RepID=A0AAD7GK38_9AGAR|nr:hypothetical protein B0H16DRAFT_1484403 [Mycena metata]
MPHKRKKAQAMAPGPTLSTRATKPSAGPSPLSTNPSAGPSPRSNNPAAEDSRSNPAAGLPLSPASAIPASSFIPFTGQQMNMPCVLFIRGVKKAELDPNALASLAPMLGFGAASTDTNEGDRRRSHCWLITEMDGNNLRGWPVSSGGHSLQEKITRLSRVSYVSRRHRILGLDTLSEAALANFPPPLEPQPRIPLEKPLTRDSPLQGFLCTEVVGLFKVNSFEYNPQKSFPISKFLFRTIQRYLEYLDKLEPLVVQPSGGHAGEGEAGGGTRNGGSTGGGGGGGGKGDGGTGGRATGGREGEGSKDEKETTVRGVTSEGTRRMAAGPEDEAQDVEHSDDDGDDETEEDTESEFRYLASFGGPLANDLLLAATDIRREKVMLAYDRSQQRVAEYLMRQTFLLSTHEDANPPFAVASLELFLFLHFSLSTGQAAQVNQILLSVLDNYPSIIHAQRNGAQSGDTMSSTYIYTKLPGI